MRVTRMSVILELIIGACSTFAHQYGSYRQSKFEDGFLISWDGVSSDPSANQVNVADANGKMWANVAVLKPVPDANRVSIYDVAVSGNRIAVAAVFQSQKGYRAVRPTSSLLVFDSKGQLVSAFALAPSYAVRKLVFDGTGNLWTLNDHADVEADPSTVPMLVEYSAEGKVERELLPRNLFPFHALDTKEDVKNRSARDGVLYREGLVLAFRLNGTGKRINYRREVLHKQNKHAKQPRPKPDAVEHRSRTLWQHGGTDSRIRRNPRARTNSALRVVPLFRIVVPV